MKLWTSLAFISKLLNIDSVEMANMQVNPLSVYMRCSIFYYYFWVMRYVQICAKSMSADINDSNKTFDKKWWPFLIKRFKDRFIAAFHAIVFSMKFSIARKLERLLRLVRARYVVQQ